MLNRAVVLTAGAFALLAGVACAQEGALRSAIESKFPRAKIESITKLPGLGLYELVIDGEIYYSDAQFSYLIDGNIIDTKTMNSLTAARKREIEERETKEVAFAFNELPFELAFKKVVGDGSRKVAYFADPNCGFCKRFDRDTLPKVNNVTVYMFMYPIISEQSNPLSKSIWCSTDRAKAWDDYVVRGTAPKAAPTCDNPIEKILEFGHKKRIRGTPTFFFADGSRVAGAMKLEQFEEILANTSKK
ncbi:MAG: DsbC family protein [Burkholderiales bacterium]